MDLELRGKKVLITGGNLLEITDERWRQGWDLKVFGFINLTREIYRRMRERKTGAIVNVIGVAGPATESCGRAHHGHEAGVLLKFSQSAASVPYVVAHTAKLI